VRRVFQTSFGRLEGNCFPACLASILEIPLASIPHFCRDHKDHVAAAAEWLSGHNITLVHVQFDKKNPESIEDEFFAKQKGLHHIMCGHTYPGGLGHVVVGLDGKIVHDPLPMELQKTFKPDREHYLFAVLDPSKVVGCGGFIINGCQGQAAKEGGDAIADTDE